MKKKALDAIADHLQRLWVPALLAACTFAFAAGASSATDRKLLPDGSVHTVSVEARTGTGLWGGGTKIVDRVQKPDGSVEIKIVPGTDDRVLEADPAMSVSPNSGLPVLVFTKQIEAGTEVLFSMYDGIRWSAPQFLTTNQWDDRKPLVVAGRSGYIHVMWEASLGAGSSTAYYEAILSAGGAIILSPTQSPVRPEMVLVPEPASALQGIFGSEVLFAFASAPPFEKQKLICLGGADEPMPVLSRIDFVLSDSAALVDHVKIERVGTGLVLFARQPKVLLYTVGSAAGWSAFRSVNLELISEEKAEILIKEMAALALPR